MADEAREKVERGTAHAFEHIALTLTAGLSLTETLEGIARQARQSVDAGRCTVNVLDGDELVPLAVDGEPDPAADRAPFPLTTATRRRLEDRPAFLLRQPRGHEDVAGLPAVTVLETVALVPLRHTHELVGLMVLNWPDSPALEPPDLLHLDAFGGYAAVAIVADRHATEARRVQLARATRALVARRHRAAPLVRDLDQLLAPTGVRVVGLSVGDEAARRHLGASVPTAEEKTGWATGRHVVALPGDVTAVALVADRRVVGSLHVCPGPRDGGALAAELGPVTDQLAAAVDRVRLTARTRRAVDHRAAEVEREQMVAEATRVADHVLGAVEHLARHHLEDVRLPTTTVPGLASVVDLARRGHEEMRRLLDAAAHLPSGRRSLPHCLRALGRQAERTAGIEMIWHLRGTPVDLDPALERALYRIAAEAITVACRHGRGAVIRLDIEYGDRVRLEVHDDGVPVHRRAPGDSRYLLMRRMAVSVGASLEVRNASPTGAIVTVRAPRRLAR